MKAKALFYIRLRDGPSVQRSTPCEFPHLFADSSSARRWRPTRRWLLPMCLFLTLCILGVGGIHLFF